MRVALLRLAFVALAASVALPVPAQGAEDVTICVTDRVPRPIPPCYAGSGKWSVSGSVTGSGSALNTCRATMAPGRESVEIDLELIGDPGDSIDLKSIHEFDFATYTQCNVPEPNPCGLSCNNVYSARTGRWRLTGGTGQWANIRGQGTTRTLINKEYDGEGLCPGGTDAECSSNLCDAVAGRCFRRIAHSYFSGLAHIPGQP